MTSADAPIQPNTGLAARRDALDALAAAEAFCRGDEAALDAVAPTTAAAAMGQRNLLVAVVGDMLDATGGPEYVAKVRASILAGYDDAGAR